MLKIELTHWMCHQELVLDLGKAPVAFVVGVNGAGKTSIRDAIEFAYLGTGQLRGIPTKKELGQLSISDGARECCVTVTTDLVCVSRTMDRQGKQTLQRRDRPAPDTRFDDWRPVKLGDGDLMWGEAADAVRVMLDPFAFFSLEPQRRRELLVTATTSGEAQVEEIASRLVTAMKGRLEDDAEKAQVKTEHPTIQALAKACREEGFRVAEARAVEQRRAQKRARDDLDLTEPTAAYVDQAEGVEPFEVDLSEHELAAHEHRLGEIRDELAQAQQTRAHDLGALEAKLEAAQQAHRTLMAEEIPPPNAGPAKRLADAEKALEEARMFHVERQGVVEELQPKAAPAEEFERPRQCPALPALKCPVKDTTFQKALAGAEEQRQEAARDLQAAQEQADAAKSALEAAESAATAAREDAAAEEALEERRAEVDRQVEAAEEAINQADRALREAQDADAQPAADADVEALERRVERGARIVDRKRAYDQAVATLEERRGTAGRLEAAIRLWDAAAQSLKPDGIESALGGDAGDAFRELLQAVVPELRLTADFDLVATLPPGTNDALPSHRHVLQLSHSQQMRVGFAIQHAFAQLVGFPLLVCDALDTFDGEGRQNWLAFAREASESYSGVLGLATLSVEQPTPPPAGVITFWLQPDGECTRLGDVGF